MSEVVTQEKSIAETLDLSQSAVVSYSVPQGSMMERGAAALAERAAALPCTTNDEFSIAVGFGKGLLKEQQDLEEQMEKINRPLLDALAANRAVFAPAIKTITQARADLKVRLESYLDEQKKLKAEQEAMERARIRKEQEEAAERAKAHEEAGRIERAEVLRERAESAAPRPVTNVAVPKAKGMANTEEWFGEVVDVKAFYNAVAAGTVPKAAAPIDQKFIDKQAKALKNELNYPGVKVGSKTKLRG